MDFRHPVLISPIGAPEKNMASNSSNLAWRISWTEEPQINSVAQSCQTLATPWTAALQASLSITNSRSLLILMSIKSVVPSSHLILCCPLFFPPSIFPSIRVFSNESSLCIRWPKYRSFSFSISPSNEYSGQITFRMDRFDLLAVQGTSGGFSNTIVQEHQFFGAQLS